MAVGFLPVASLTVDSVRASAVVETLEIEVHSLTQTSDHSSCAVTRPWVRSGLFYAPAPQPLQSDLCAFPVSSL